MSCTEEATKNFLRVRDSFPVNSMEFRLCHYKRYKFYHEHDAETAKRIIKSEADNERFENWLSNNPSKLDANIMREIFDAMDDEDKGEAE